MWRSLVLVVYGLIQPVDGKDYREGFKFVGGFLGLDSKRTAQRSNHTGLSVIGAGFSRTGTKSTEAALLRLGHKIYDTRSMLELKQADQWVEAAIRIGTSGDTELADELLRDIESRGYTATLDFPMNLFGTTFAELRPSAKVLFTTRDVDRWFESWYNVNVIMGAFILRPWSWVVDFSFVGQICGAFDFPYIYASYPDHIDRPLPWYETVHFLPSFTPDDSKEKWISFHDRVKKQLQESLPTSRFIAFDVRQGWAPLLAFLQVDDPKLAAEPFPNVNDIESLKMVRRVMDIVAIGLPLWLAIVGGLLLYLLSYLVAKVARCFRRGGAKRKSA